MPGSSADCYDWIPFWRLHAPPLFHTSFHGEYGDHGWFTILDFAHPIFRQNLEILMEWTKPVVILHFVGGFSIQKSGHPMEFSWTSSWGFSSINLGARRLQIHAVHHAQILLHTRIPRCLRGKIGDGMTNYGWVVVTGISNGQTRKKTINDERLPTPSNPSNRNTSFEKSMTCPKNRKNPGASRTCWTKFSNS